MKKLLPILFFVIICNSEILAQKPIELQYETSFNTSLFDESAAEIVTFDPQSNRLFFSNGFDNSFEILDISDPTAVTFVNTIDLSPYGGGANSIKSYDGWVAVAVQDINTQANGKVVFFDNNGVYINDLTVGALPDMLTIAPATELIVVANEGEPDDDYIVDPEGSVSIIDFSGGIANLTQNEVTNISFSGITSGDLDNSTRIFGNDGTASIAQDLEPEYITVNHSGDTAFVVCQENNAIMGIDLINASIVDIFGLGYKDHSLAANGFDASNESETVQIEPHPVFGMYLPDAIAYYNYNGSSYVFTANEGDSRDYDGYSEEERIKDLVLDSIAFPNYEELQNDTVLGRLNITLSQGDTDNDGEFEELYAYGARSFSVYEIASGQQVFDSEDDFEQITFQEIPAYFNSTNDDNDSFKNRSDDKGPEPEAITIGSIGDRDFVFIGMERVGGIFVYEIIDPTDIQYVEYINVRDFSKDADDTLSLDIAPEDLLFISSDDSPNGDNLLIASNEVSGSISVYTIQVNFPVGLEAQADNKFNVYPNPANRGIINFSQEFSGEIINLQGSIIGNYNNVKSIDISDFQKGIYLVKSQKGITLKLIVE